MWPELVLADGALCFSKASGEVWRTIRVQRYGKEHHYWSLVENKRMSGGRVVQRHVLYLG